MGAAITTGLIARFRECAGAYVFDSPGVPESISRSVLATKKPIVAVNATPNPINTLHKPTATGQGQGVEFHVDSLWNFVSTVLPNRLLVSWILKNIEGNKMTSIIDYIDKGRVVETSIQSWPTYSRSVVRILGGALPAAPPIDPTNEPLENPDRDIPTTPIQNAEGTNVPSVNRIDAYNAVPNATRLADLEPNTLYKIANTDDFAALFGNLPPDAIVLPMIGLTGQGKTLTMLSLLGLHEQYRHFVRAGINNSIYPLLAHWHHPDLPGKVYLLDLPGIGGAYNNTAPSWSMLFCRAPANAPQEAARVQFIRNTFQGLMVPIRRNIALVLFVTKQNFVASDIPMLKEIHSFGLNVIVGQNVLGTIRVRNGEDFRDLQAAQQSILSRVWTSEADRKMLHTFSRTVRMLIHCGQRMSSRSVT